MRQNWLKWERVQDTSCIEATGCNCSLQLSECKCFTLLNIVFSSLPHSDVLAKSSYLDCRIFHIILAKFLMDASHHVPSSGYPLTEMGSAETINNGSCIEDNWRKFWLWHPLPHHNTNTLLPNHTYTNSLPHPSCHSFSPLYLHSHWPSPHH